MADKTPCSKCGKRVAWDQSHTCVGPYGELEEFIDPWWVDTAKDQLAEDPRSNRGGGTSNQMPWWFWSAVMLTIVISLVIMYLLW